MAPSTTRAIDPRWNWKYRFISRSDSITPRLRRARPFQAERGGEGSAKADDPVRFPPFAAARNFGRFFSVRGESPVSIQAPAPTKESISLWLTEWIAKELGLPAAEIETSQSLLNYSLSSVTAMMLVGDLEEWL